MVPSSDLLARISLQHPDVLKASDEINDTARSYQIPGYAGSFGFISSMSDHFCRSCNRLRITADGKIKVCRLSIGSTFRVLTYMTGLPF
jgi:molybdenum cofactor biosynthesis enzyme MoaA